MNHRTVKIAATAIGLFMTTGALAADQTSTEAHGDLALNVAMPVCVNAIRQHHPKRARLFLNNKTYFSVSNGRRYLNVTGWVWKGGERIRVTHQCSDAGRNQVGLRVIYEGNEQLAKR